MYMTRAIALQVFDAAGEIKDGKIDNAIQLIQQARLDLEKVEANLRRLQQTPSPH